jgi:PKD repeat protein
MIKKLLLNYFKIMKNILFFIFSIFFVHQIFAVDIFRGETDTLTMEIFTSAAPYNSYDLNIRDFPDFLEFSTVELYSLYSFYTYRYYISFELKAKENAPLLDTTFFIDFEFNISGANYRYDTVQVDVRVLDPQIVAGFDAGITEGPKPLTVNFINISSGKFDSFYWDFGDGGFSEAENPVHKYDSSGIFTVSLVVSNESTADTVSKESYIRVFDMPTAKLTGGGGICPGDSVLFTFTFSGSPPWEFAWSDGVEEFSDTSNEIEYNFFAKDSGIFFMTELTDSNDTTLYLFEDTISVWINQEPEMPEIGQNADTLFVPESDSVQWYLNGIAIHNATSNQLVIDKSGNYFAEVFNGFGCSNASPELFFVYSHSDLIKPKDKWVTIFPNPFSEYITVSFSKDIIGMLQYEIINLNGSVVELNQIKQTSNHSESLNTSQLPSGTYMLRISSRNKQIIKKIVKRQSD